MKTTYDLVRERIVELVPELKELKLGCEIHFLTDNEEEKQFIYHVSQNHPGWFEAKTDATDGKYLDYSKSDWEILGTEPQLHDVLRAIENTGKIRGIIGQKMNVKASDFDSVESAKRFAYNNLENWDKEVELTAWMKELLIRWNLAQPLSGQSEETLSFILKLLTV